MDEEGFQRKPDATIYDGYGRERHPISRPLLKRLIRQRSSHLDVRRDIIPIPKTKKPPLSAKEVLQITHLKRMKRRENRAYHREMEDEKLKAED